MYDVPRSKAFDDIYFSADDGVAESEFVFLQGNNLPENWVGKDSFTIAETGFGTGLNFFLSWELQEKYAPEMNLNFLSYELHPMSIENIQEGLAKWDTRFAEKIKHLEMSYPDPSKEGFYSFKLSETVSLSLYFGDVNVGLPDTKDFAVDAWFLDGFTPSKNPLMWTDNVFGNMARLSRPGTTFATFTSAGFVKRGLQNAGFAVEKGPGFGRKRERLLGVYGRDVKQMQKDTPCG